MSFIRIVGFVITIVVAGATASYAATEVSFSKKTITFDDLTGSPQPQTIKISPSPNSHFRIESSQVRWQTQTAPQPLRFTISSAPLPADVTVSLDPAFYGDANDKLLIPITLVDGIAEGWRRGETRTFEVAAFASRPCLSQSGCSATEPLGPRCMLKESKYIKIKVKDYQTLVSKMVLEHAKEHFSAYLNYKRAVSTLWTPLGINGPMDPCCPCNPSPSPACKSIDYKRWGPSSKVADVEWTGDPINFTEQDPTGTASVTIGVPAQITQASVQVNASFLEYIFTNTLHSPSLALKEAGTGSVIVQGQVECYNFSLDYGYVRFRDRNTLPIRLEAAP